MRRPVSCCSASALATPPSDGCVSHDVDLTSMPRYVEHGYPWADWDLLRARGTRVLVRGPAPVLAVLGRHPLRRRALRVEPPRAVLQRRCDPPRHRQRHRPPRGLQAEAGRTPRLGPRRRRSTCCTPTVPSTSTSARSPCAASPPGAMRRLAEHLDELARRFVEGFVRAARRPRRRSRSTWWRTCRSACRSPPSAACSACPTDDWPTIRRWSDQTLLTPGPQPSRRPAR